MLFHAINQGKEEIGGGGGGDDDGEMRRPLERRGRGAGPRPLPSLGSVQFKLYVIIILFSPPFYEYSFHRSQEKVVNLFFFFFKFGGRTRLEEV